MDRKGSFICRASKFHRFIKNLPVINSIPYIDGSSFIGSCVVPKLNLSSHSTTSSIVCDGNYVYILGGHSTLYQISLSKLVSTTQNRFSMQEIKIEKRERIELSLLISNGTILITGPFLSKTRLIKTQPLEESDESLKFGSSFMSGKLSHPFATDGYFIYSLNGQKVNVFSVQQRVLTLHRTVKLQPSKNAVLTEGFGKSLIPKNMSDVVLISNGVVLTMIKLSEKAPKAQNRFFYAARHFSLLDGTHIIDTDICLKTPILSMCCDPWNKCIWCLSPSSTKAGVLIKFKYRGSYPLWLTGVDFNFVKTRREIDDFTKDKTVQALSHHIIDFIAYFVAHFAGSSFTTEIKNSPDQICAIPRFFAPRTNQCINEIVSAIEYFELKLKSPDPKHREWTQQQMQKAMKVLIYLLDFNLSNLSAYSTDSASSQIENSKVIMDLLCSLLLDQRYAFLKSAICFTFINSFDALMSEKNEKAETIFNHILETMNSNIVLLMINRLSKSQNFCYCFSQKTFRNVFAPIIKKMTGMSSELNRNHFELINSFLRSITLELYQAYETNTGFLSNETKSLHDTFLTFSGILTEEMITLIKHTGTPNSPVDMIRFQPLTRLFQKWLLLLHPFVKFSRMSSGIVSLLQPLYADLISKLKTLNIKPETTSNGFKFIYGLFYDLFSLYVDFISALIDGGSELRDVQQYTWLIKSTLLSNLSIDRINQLVEEFNKPIVKTNSLFKKGFSFNSLEKQDKDDEEVNDFLSSLVAVEESPGIKKLMDYIYQKVKDVTNRKLTADDRHNERIIFAVLIKHLGFAAATRDLSIEIASDQKPVLNHYIRQGILTIYKIRHQLKNLRQDWKRNTTEANESGQEFVPKSLHEDFPKFLNEMKKKCIFLLHIQPCSRFRTDDNADMFSAMIKNITNFIIANVTLESYFTLLQEAQKIQANVASGLGLINSALSDHSNHVCTSYMVEKFASTNSISTYLLALSDTPKATATETPGFKNVMMLMNHVRSLLVADSQEYQKNTLLVFLANLLYSLSHVAPEEMFDPLTDLVNQIFSQQDKFSPEMFSSFIAFIVSSIIVITENNSAMANSPHFAELSDIILKYKEYTHTRQAIGMLFHRSGIYKNQSPLQVFGHLSDTSPDQFQAMRSFFHELTCNEKDKVLTMFPVFEQIANICSGGVSIVLNKRPLVANVAENTETCVTPDIILAGANVCIELIRRFLSENDESVKNIITYILEYNSPDRNVDEECNNKNWSDYSIFSDPKMLFAVFAILSNITDVFCFGSMLKVRGTNKTYFVNGYDKKENKIKCWQMPITANSVEECISLDSTMEHVTLLPFKPEMFPRLDLLVPYFKKYFGDIHTYQQSGLSYYVLSSLKEYLSVPSITNYLPQIFGDKMDVSELHFFSTKPYFTKLLKSHLTDSGTGLNSNGSFELSFNIASPSSLLPSNFAITKNVISVKDTQKGNYHVFVTQCLPTDQPSYLTIRIDGKPTSTVVCGLCAPNIVNYANPHILRVYKDGKLMTATVQSNNVSMQHNESTKIPTYIFEFNPQKMTGEVFDNKNNSILLYRFPYNLPFFFIEITGEANIAYSFSKTISANNLFADNNNNGNSKGTREFDYQKMVYELHRKSDTDVIPISGKTVFQRVKGKCQIAVSQNTTKKEFTDQMMFSIKPSTNVDVNIKNFRRDFTQMNKAPTVASEDGSSCPNLMIPVSVERMCSSSLNITSKQNLDSLEIGDPHYTVNIVSDPSREESHLLFQYNTATGPYQFVSFDGRYLNPLTGSITSAPNFSFIDLYHRPLIHPEEFSYFPQHLTNYFISGCAAELKNEIVTQSYLMQISSPNAQQNFDSIISSFNNISIRVLCQHLIALLTLCEPRRADYLIDFDLNYLDQSEIVSSDRTAYQQAALSIFEYFLKKEEPLPQFVDTFYSVVRDRINEKHWHTALDIHPYAIHSPKNMCNFIPKRGTQKYIVFSNDAKNFSTYTIEESYHSLQYDDLIIPLMENSNISLLGTFFELYVGFKYLVYVCKTSSKFENMYRANIYTLFIDCLISNSAYISKSLLTVLQFLQKNMPTIGPDIQGNFLVRLNILASFSMSIPPAIAQFLDDQQNLWDERVLLPLKKHFPEFLTPGDIAAIEEANLADEKVRLPSNLFPDKFEQKQREISVALGMVKRILLPRSSITGFPFHFIITLWTSYSITYPPHETRMKGNIMTLKFLTYVPSVISLDMSGDVSIDVELLESEDSESGAKMKSNSIQTEGRQTIILKCFDKAWASYQFIVKSTSSDILPDEYIVAYKDRFISDVTTLTEHWDTSHDQKILQLLNYNVYTSQTLSTELDPSVFIRSEDNFHLPLLLIRAKLLLLLNWLVATKHLNLDEDRSLQYLTPSVASPLKLRRFQEIVQEHSRTSRPSLTINRKAAFDVREGSSDNLSRTIMAQISKVYTPDRYRDNTNRPWQVTFVDEPAIDAGGPARELVSECAMDLVSPNCGLVIPVPNARNEVGFNREYVIPFPNPRAPNPMQQYKFAGAFIAICIRTGLVQELNFPPLVWDFLVTGKFSFEKLYEIDQNYKLLIESLQEAKKSGITDEQFRKQFDLSFVVYNSAGVECTLKAGGRLEKVTLSNMSLFINLAQEFRKNELLPQLEAMREGMWTNLNFRPIFSLDGPTLEFAACGEKDITYEALKEICEFSDIPNSQRDMFFNVIKRFTPEERSMLIKFATGRVRLPPKGSPNSFKLVIDSSPYFDKLPTASTCFHQLHMPQYSSEEKMYIMVKAAASYTGSMENA